MHYMQTTDTVAGGVA